MGARQRLEEMMMGVDEAGQNDVAARVECRVVSRLRPGRADQLDDPPVLDDQAARAAFGEHGDGVADPGSHRVRSFGGVGRRALPARRLGLSNPPRRLRLCDPRVSRDNGAPNGRVGSKTGEPVLEDARKAALLSEFGREPVPTLFRFLVIIAVLAGLVYGGMIALVTMVKVQPREMTEIVKIPKAPK